MSERLPCVLDDDDVRSAELARIEEKREALRVQKDPPLPTNPKVEQV